MIREVPSFDELTEKGKSRLKENADFKIDWNERLERNLKSFKIKNLEKPPTADDRLGASSKFSKVMKILFDDFIEFSLALNIGEPQTL